VIKQTATKVKPEVKPTIREDVKAAVTKAEDDVTVKAVMNMMIWW
jgi:hypothetical protein